MDRGLLHGRDRPSRQWYFIEVVGDASVVRSVRARDGRVYARYPLGFPFRIVLRDPGRTLPQAGRLRLMKAVSLAFEDVYVRDRSAGRLPDDDDPILEVVVESADTPPAGGVELCRSSRTSGPIADAFRISIHPDWLRSANDSAIGLRVAMEEKLRSTPPRDTDEDVLPALGAGRAGAGDPPKVLLFRNIFSEYHVHRSASHISPGTGALASALERQGARVVLGRAQLVHHDPCSAVPRRDLDMRPEEFLVNPGDLDDVLARNPDIDLVALTVIEFCYNHTRHLVRYIKERTSALIAMGGTWPTTAPEHAFAHLPEVDFLVRGDGEDVIAPLARAAAGARSSGDLESGVMELLGGSRGVLARWDDTVVSLCCDEENRIDDLNRTHLDFSLFAEPDVRDGISVSLSRGCIFNCLFCTIMNRKVWRGLSPRRVEALLASYEGRLREIYGQERDVPPSAREIYLWDDDFFIDGERASHVLRIFREAGFRIMYVQGSVRSFFVREGYRVVGEVNAELLEEMARSVEAGALQGILIGIESYCDEELRRLGKPHTFSMIREMTMALAHRSIPQSHMMILVNEETSLENLLENLTRLAALRRDVGPGLHFNDPCWLLDIATTPLFKACVVRGSASAIPDLGVAMQPGYPELDYPFVAPVRPRCDEVYEIARRFPRSQHYGTGGEPGERFHGIYGPDDRDFTMALGYIRAFLERRRVALDGDERRRIDAALDRFLPSH